MDKHYILTSLDIILSTLNNDRGYISFDDLKKRLDSNGLKIDGDRLNKLLDILEHDLYINKPMGDNYAITGKGMIFIGFDLGYLKKNERDLEDAKRSDYLAKKANEILINTYRIGVVVALGTSIAAWYYLIEIYKYYYPVFCH